MGLPSLSPFSHSGRCRSVGCRICRVPLFGPVSTCCHTPSSKTSCPSHTSTVRWLFYIVLHGTNVCACCSAFWNCHHWVSCKASASPMAGRSQFTSWVCPPSLLGRRIWKYRTGPSLLCQPGAQITWGRVAKPSSLFKPSGLNCSVHRVV